MGGFWNQQFRYGRGAYLFHRARARRKSGRLAVDFRFYVALLGSAFARATGGHWLALEGLIVLSQIAVAAGLACEWLVHAVPSAEDAPNV